MLTNDKAWPVGVERIRAGVNPSIESCAGGLPKSEAEVHKNERVQGQIALTHGDKVKFKQANVGSRITATDIEPAK